MVEPNVRLGVVFLCGLGGIWHRFPLCVSGEYVLPCMSNGCGLWRATRIM